MYKILILFIGLFFSACSVKSIYPKQEEKIYRFYIPVKVEVKEKSTKWYKKEGTSFIGIIDSNSSIGGEFYKNEDNVTGEVLFFANKGNYISLKSKIFDCNNGKTNLEYDTVGNDIYPIYVLRKQVFCFKYR